MPYNSLKIISEGWFNSVLIYCLPLYGGSEKGKLEDLQILQNKVARLVLNLPPWSNRAELYGHIGWMTVKQMVFYHTSTTIFRVRKTKEPEHLASYLVKENRNNNIIVPQSNLTLYRRSFIYRGILSWNSIPKEIRNTEKIEDFKKMVKVWIFQNIPRF